MTTSNRAGEPRALVNMADKRGFLLRLVLAEVIARPGEGPLTPRFARPSAGFGRAPSLPEREEPTTPEPR